MKDFPDGDRSGGQFPARPPISRSPLTLLGLAVLLQACPSEPPPAPPKPPPPLPAEASESQTLFRDISAESGLDFTHSIGATGQYYFAEIMGAGAALLDYDRDGDLDVYLVQGAMLGKATSGTALFPPPAAHWPGNRLFRNDLGPDGSLAFVDVTDTAGVGDVGYGMGVAAGDVDADGDTDLYVTNFGDNVFYRNNDDGTFTAMPRAAGAQDSRWSTSAAFLDYDRDGDLDLYVASYVSFSLTYNKRCTSPAGQQDYCGPQSYEALTDRLFRNDGGWRFTDVSRASGIDRAVGSGLGVTCADFDGDGLTDIYVANDQLANMLWRNQGDGSFVETALMAGAAYNADGAAEASMGVTAGDFDGDGDEDLFMTHLAQQTNTLYVNDGSGTFMDATDRFNIGRVSVPFTGFGAQWFDYDNDGALDMFVANGAVLVETAQLGQSRYPYAQANQLFHNDGRGHFANLSRRAGQAMLLEEVSRGAAFGDIDNDGDIDIVVTNNNGPARLLLNEAGTANHWLRVVLKGRQSTRDGTGARVAVTRDGAPTLWRRAHTDGSYLSASDPRVHFGLGESTSVTAVVVHWPGGVQEMWKDVDVDAQHVLEQGSGEPIAP